MLPSLDAHAHLNHSRQVEEVSACGSVLAMTLSLEEAETALQRSDPYIAWGVGCHPRFLCAQQAFNAKHFTGLAERTAIIGEVGLDGGSRVPMERQLQVFRKILEITAGMPRLVSIHAYQAMNLVLDELEGCPISVPIIHWWTGNVPDTRRAVELGCYFSVHSAVARHSKFRNHVPVERILVESDHGENDPPAAIPCRVEWVEYLVAQQYHLEVVELRRIVWENFTRLVEQVKCVHLLPEGLKSHLLLHNSTHHNIK